MPSVTNNRGPRAAHRGSDREELASALTHGAGLVASLVAGSLLIVGAALRGDPWRIVGAAVFTATLVLLYAASTAYHSAREPGRRARLQVLDHAAIYLLIAGTYTPFTLGALRGAWGWSLFGVIWGLAVAGVVFKLFAAGRMRGLSTAIYVGMGWLVLVAAGPLVRELARPTLLWLVAGGVLYTAGTAFYHNRRIPFAHAVWHLFVLGGSLCHAAAVGSHL